MQGYELAIAQGGAKLRRSSYEELDDPDGAKRGPQNRTTTHRGQDGERITGVITLGGLASMLGTDLGMPMIDKTGLDGFFGIDFTWNRPYVRPTMQGQASPNSSEAATPEVSKTATLFPALEKQLGLKVTPVKISINVLIVDSITTTPTEN